MNKKTIRIAKNLALLALAVLLSIVIVLTFCKIVTTAIELEFMNYDVTDYNNSPVKTDMMTEYIQGVIDERDEEFYHSENVLVRTFSNQHRFIKIIIVVIAAVVMLATVVFWVWAVPKTWHNIAKARRRKRRLARRQAARES